MELVVENKRGEQFNISSSLDYEITQITGLTPPNANINLSEMALSDGSTFNSSRLDTRNITITIAPTNNVERSRVNLYRYFKTKQYVKLYLKTKLRDVYIDGYVESMDGDLYENPQSLMVSIICPNPYFKDNKNVVVDFSTVTGMFEFEYEPIEEGKEISLLEVFQETIVVNPSDSDSGAIFDLHAIGNVVEPIIYNQTTNESFQLNFEMLEGDHITINTNKGSKGVKLIRNGVETNLLNKVDKSSKWITMLSGDNVISYVCAYGNENVNMSVTIRPIYGGV